MKMLDPNEGLAALLDSLTPEQAAEVRAFVNEFSLVPTSAVRE